MFAYVIPNEISFQNEFILVVASDRNVCSRTKSSQTFHKYHIKEVRAHSGTGLDTWIGWADQLTYVCTALSFQNENFYVNAELTMCACHTRMKFILVLCKHHLTLARFSRASVLILGRF